MAYNKPALRNRLKNQIMAGSKGGNAGQWSARKAQLLNRAYEKAGGGYTGPKTAAQSNLSKWTSEKWQTKSGKPSTQGRTATGERYLPKSAIKSLSSAEYKATSDKKRRGTRQGKQFVPNTKPAKAAGRAARKAK
jgi:hypothetical protein